MVGYDHLWATWRSQYVTRECSDDELVSTDEFSLFEQILNSAGPDIETGIVKRFDECFVLLNRFPYTSGHLMVLPNRRVGGLDELSSSEFTELFAVVRDATTALRIGLNAEAINVGLNLGQAAGGSQSDHLHVHCVPRWTGDANFMTTTALTRVLPISLEEIVPTLQAAWPTGENHT